MKLGKLVPKLQKNAPSLHRLMRGALPVAPDKVDWTTKLTGEPMFANDKLGDCTIATVAHITRIWTSEIWGEELDIPDEMISRQYFALTGGEDTGLAETDVLSWWHTTGFDMPDRQYTDCINGWCSLNLSDLNTMHLSVYFFGAAYLGLSLPAACQDMDVWDVPEGHSLKGDWAPGSWGGHAVPAVAYDKTAGTNTILTWGKKKTVTDRFLTAYLDEAHGPISRTWLDTKGVAPNGFDLAHLQACMSLIAE